jgi:pimeloyl-ACP methyl ester carboxylesterase
MKWLVLLALLSCHKPADEPHPAKGAPTSEAAKPPAGTAERWATSFVVGAAIRDGVVAFTPPVKAGDAWTAQLEGLTPAPLPLSGVTYTADKITFTIDKPKAPEAAERYTLARVGPKASGQGTIGASTLAVKMIALAAGEAPHTAFLRPQTPTGPFPYEARDVTVDAPGGGKLAGTLTFPKGGAAAPAVLLWSGSGQQDRDETIFNHKPYLIVADRLTRDGFAVLRLDDRGVGKTTGATGTLDTEIADAGAAIEFLKAQREVDPKRVGMIAHSSGGMVAPEVALAHPLAFVVSLAGVALPGRELVPLQQEITAKVQGVTIPPEQLALQRRVGEATLKGADEVRRVLAEVAGPQLEQALGHKPTAEELDKALAPTVAAAMEPWSRSYFRIDPREAWKKLTLPVLLLVGELDTQVPADVTIAALTGAHGKRDAVTTKKLPGLNHLFQHARTGLIDEYVQSEETFAPEALDAVASWLAARAKAGGD